MKNQPAKLPDIFAENPNLPILNNTENMLLVCDGHTHAAKQIIQSHENDFFEVCNVANVMIALTGGKSILYVKDSACVTLQIGNSAYATIVLSGNSLAKIVCLSGSEAAIQLFDNAQLEIELHERAKSKINCLGKSKASAKVASLGRSDFEAWGQASVDLKISKGKHYLTAFTTNEVRVEVDSEGASLLDAYIYQNTKLQAKVGNNGNIQIAANHTSTAEIELDSSAKAEIRAAHQSVVTLKAPVPNNVKTVLLNDAAVVKINCVDEAIPA